MANTSTDFRVLSLRSVDDVFVDAEQLVAAERSGTLERYGNWTLGQAFGHVAAWASYPYEGYPIAPPWFVRVVGRWFMKKRFIVGPMPRGKRIPGVEGGTHGTEVFPTDEGLARLRAAFERLRRDAPTVINPLLGPLTHDEWIRLNLNHAALHLGFFGEG